MIIIKILIVLLAALGTYHLYENICWFAHKIKHPEEIIELLDIMEKQRDKK